MAGFVGLVRLGGERLSEKFYSKFFQAALGGRPFCQDSYVSPGQDLAFARLHRGVLNPAPQPVGSPDGRTLLFLEGEVFNEDLDLKQQPAAVLQAYLREGETLFSRLNGSFALAIIEPDRRRLQLVTDRTASVPVFYLRQGHLLAFAPELRPLIALLDSGPKISSQALSNFLSGGCILEGRSLLSDIASLRPARVLTIQDEQIETREYWQFSYDTRRDQQDPRILEEELLHLMMKAVERHTKDDIPFAITLSGGYDSRSILACMRRLYPDRPIQTVTWGDQEDRPGSDAVVAQRTADYYRTQHRFYHLNAAALPDHFRSFVRASEGRVDTPGNYPESLRIFERIRDDAQVRLLFRGNEFFGVRSRVTREKDSWFVAFIPDLYSLPYSFRYVKPEIYRKLADLGYEQMHRLYQELPYDDPIDRKDHLFITQRWPGYHSPLTQLKRQILEERNPYLDNDLMSFVSRLPAHYRVWKNFYISTVQHQLPEFQQLGASRVISLVDWDTQLRTTPSLQAFVRRVLLEERNGFDDIFDRARLTRYLDRVLRPQRIHRRSLLNRARRKIRYRLDRFELDISLELFRLIIVKIWISDFLQGHFELD